MTTHLDVLHRIQVEISDSTRTAHMCAEQSRILDQLSMADLSSIFTEQAEQTISSIRCLRDELASELEAIEGHLLTTSACQL